MEIQPVTWWMKQVLGGVLPLEDAPLSVQSWARLPLFEGAREIVLMDTKEERMAELARVPALIRPHVEAEVRRLWPMRGKLVDR